MKKTIITTIAAAGLMSLSAFGNSIYELGQVVPSEPANPTEETTMLTALISHYNAGGPFSPFNIVIGPHTDVGLVVPGSALPAAPLGAPGVNNGQVVINNGPSNSYSVNLGAGGYNYLMIKWGRSSEFYDVAGLTGTVAFSNDINQNGISHFDIWGPGTTVPDGGTTVVLLGAALSGLGLMRRKLS